jgi:alpha-amylase
MKGIVSARLGAGMAGICVAAGVAACGIGKTSASTPETAGAASASSSIRVPAQADAIVHMFDIPFRLIESELPVIAAAGFGAIQISPPQLSNGDAWWGRYQPLDYRIIDSPLGNEADLRSLVKRAALFGIRINADLVLNHMANLGKDHDGFFPPKWVKEKYGVGGLFGPQDFHMPFCIRNWSNPEEVRIGRLCGGGDDPGLPDLRLDNDWVLRQQKAFIAKLNDIGIQGYRVDAVKHMDADYLSRLFTPDLVRGRHVYGEVIAFRSSFDTDLDPYLRKTSMGYMDFPLQETIREALKPQGSLEALVDPVKTKGALAFDRAVTFVVNHDIPNNEGFRYMIMDEVDEALGYAFVLGRADGVPHIMSDRGKAGGLRDDRWKMAHRRKDIGAMVRFHNAVHGSSQRFLVADRCVLIWDRGTQGLVGINKCGEAFRARVSTQVEGQAIDVLTGNEAPLGGNTELNIPPRSAVMYLKTSR